jgi:hypothetical protein
MDQLLDSAGAEGGFNVLIFSPSIERAQQSHGPLLTTVLFHSPPMEMPRFS